MTFYRQFLFFLTCTLLFTSCSSTPEITSQFTDVSSSPSPAANLESFMTSHGVARHSHDGIVYYVSNNDTHLYIMVDFVSARLFQNAIDFGFTLYVDSKNKFKRSFGITYPTGIFHELGNFPGAQSGYLEEPNWSNIQGNRTMMDMAKRNTVRHALLIQRRNRRDPFQPVPIQFSQLQAQNIQLHFSEEGRNGRISFTIPLEIRSQSQFAPDVKPGENVDLGFEINPIRILNLDQRGSVQQTTRDTSSGITRAQIEEDNQKRKNQIMQRLGEPYEMWVELTISRPAE